MNRIGSIRILGLSLVAVSLAANGGELRLRNVYSDKMLFRRDQPVAVRYMGRNRTAGVLYNQASLPLGPFELRAGQPR